MLQPAIKYSEQLKNKLRDTWFIEKYKYYHTNGYYDELQINNDTWNKHQFVSVYNDEVIGYIFYNIDRRSNFVYGLGIINFSDNKIVFGMDLGQALKDIFEKYKFRKLRFSVVIGNPIEKSYDKMIKKYNGRIVGIYKKETLLIDGKYYDEKLYEITREEYLKSVGYNECKKSE